MRWKNKNVLVTGGAGVIGQCLIARLTSAGAAVTCIDKAAKPPSMNDTVKYVHRNISMMAPEEIASTTPEYIFHLAATFERSEETPGFYDENYVDNIVVSHRVTEAARCCDGLEKFVFASSYLIYAPWQYMSTKPRAPALLIETDPINPRNLCGVSKLYTEREIKFLQHDKDFSSVSARIYRSYGIGSRDVISRWVRMALRNEELSVYQEENMFDYIYADDVADGLVRMAMSRSATGVINLGTGTPRRIADVIGAIRKTIPVPVRTKKLPGRDEYEASGADIVRLETLTGWRPKTSIENGIAKIVEYEKQRLGT